MAGLHLGVAFSGGSDSMCLLYLLGATLQDPTKLLALTVDHLFQTSSSETAGKCQRFAQQLGIEHRTLTIPWSRPPYPDLANISSKALELNGRNARYRVLFDALVKDGVDVVAMGHHLDDQVETMLMRGARESGEVGLAGMRARRRWGMGFGSRTGETDSDLTFFGDSGLQKYILRPLLPFPKSRIIATCRFHNLPYIEDQTNFDPELTIRNHIRHSLTESMRRETPELSNQLHEMITPIAKELAWGPVRSVEDLYELNGRACQLRDENDAAATDYLSRHVQSSPYGTILLGASHGGAAPPLQVQRATLLRILRYVSPRPWGSPAAEAHRRKVNLDAIGRHIWPSSTGSDAQHPLRSFVLGSEVRWTPVALTRTKGFPPFKFLRAQDLRPAPHELGWLATRQPPTREQSHHLTIDVTNHLRPTTANRSSSFTLSYDGRFRLTFITDKLPPLISKGLTEGALVVTVQLCKRWMVPEVVITHGHDGSEERFSLWTSSALVPWTSLVPFRSLDAA